MVYQHDMLGFVYIIKIFQITLQIKFQTNVVDILISRLNVSNVKHCGHYYVRMTIKVVVDHFVTFLSNENDSMALLSF